MRKIQFLAVCGLMAAWAVGAQAMNPIKPASVTVVNIEGQARYSVDGQTWHPLVPGKILHDKAVIETAAGSYCDLVISGTPVPFVQSTPSPISAATVAIAPDPQVRGYIAAKPMAQQNVIRMSPDTMLAIDRLTVIDTGADTVSTTELDLRAGKIFASVKKMSPNSQFTIKIPNGVAGIRGQMAKEVRVAQLANSIPVGIGGDGVSQGDLSADGSAEWLSGEIFISFIGSNGQPHVVAIHGGFEYDPQTGQILSLPPKVIAELKRDGAYSTTLYAQVYPIAKDLTLVFISPTQGGGGITATPPPSSGGGAP